MPQRNNTERERAVFSASSVLNALGGEIAAIKVSDRLTYADMAAVMGVSEDQVAKYSEGSATMNVVAYARAKREWNGRFSGALDRLIANTRPVADADRSCESKILRAALALSIALADDDRITPDEVRANRATLESAHEAIGMLLAMLAPRAA